MCMCPHISTVKYGSLRVLQQVAWIGGMASMDLALAAKICFLAESTLLSIHVLSYSRTKYDSITFINSSLNVAGLVDNAAIIVIS